MYHSIAELIFWIIILAFTSIKISIFILTIIILLNIYALLRMMTKLEPNVGTNIKEQFNFIVSIISSLISPFHFIGYIIVGKDNPELIRNIRGNMEKDTHERELTADELSNLSDKIEEKLGDGMCDHCKVFTKGTGKYVKGKWTCPDCR